MKTLFIGQYCIRLDKIDSTNSHLTGLLAKESLPEGAVVSAHVQEQGRGQRGTHWESEPGKNLMLSILLKPSFLKPEEQFLLSKTVSLGVLEFVRLCTTPELSSQGKGHKRAGAAVKWPNDIYIGSKKVAGILIENSVSGNCLCHSIIGIGINVNQEIFSVELPNPTSLKLVAAKEFDIDKCLEQLCSCIEKRYLQLKSNPKDIHSDYLKNLYRLDEWSNYNYKGETIKAKITGVTKTGKLVLEKEGGGIIESEMKEISFL